MANLPPDSPNATGLGPDREAGTGTPHWVKVFGIVVLVLVLVVVVIMATGLGGPHGPRRHLPSGAPAASQRP